MLKDTTIFCIWTLVLAGLYGDLIVLRVYIDLYKAFDKVNRDNLLFALEGGSINGALLGRFGLYLEDLSHSVEFRVPKIRVLAQLSYSEAENFISENQDPSRWRNGLSRDQY